MYPAELWASEYEADWKHTTEGDAAVLPNHFSHLASIHREILEDGRVTRTGFDCDLHADAPLSAAGSSAPALPMRWLRLATPLSHGIWTGCLDGGDSTVSEWSRNQFFVRHLDRLDGGNSSTPLDGEYAFNAAAGGTCKCGVRVYVLDTGIARHDDLAARLSTGGFPDSTAHDSLSALVGDRYDPARWHAGGVFDPSPARGAHGTHVASAIAGSRHGTATGPMSLLLLALDWVLADCLSSGQRCILNLSFGGRFSGDLLGWFSIPESALSALEGAGVLVVAAAGNDGGAACTFYPAASRAGLAVGAVTEPDEEEEGASHLAPFTNFGCCSDVFAPGVAPAASADQLYTAVLCMAATDVVADVCPCGGSVCAAGSQACIASPIANLTRARIAGEASWRASFGADGDAEGD
ncbi:hypothetical protein EMIHUDRAFT_216734 [Emiliania huxleyi CCMP1516]|uniref:Peptidase S8/S53 domain-containing protein n=2 Tax=Emiliania huxleyi TaxID=2903 RepID=A0A0D3IDJ3_EMIH1|nr:hypothetical protein EMIHUDRAFT_216734 [Emiliania huxleyi CCMP1516]EOD09328.1 hypothetical protein EMIHUDRAFT_216734 [Emiliania huxleyi CCMP1516]|eukprot:XP_005761757.1 hypothetical protein EMIHUDRAFT_216734 [Emiliania huxleyi CCMP1516]